MGTNKLLTTIKKWADELGTQVCFETGTDSLTYAQLEAASNKLATYLCQNVPRQAPIILFGSLSKEMVIAFIACQKSGNPYVPIDDQTPADRIQLIVSCAQPACILAFEAWPLNEIPAIEQDEFTQLLKETAPGTVDPLRAVCGDDLLYIIFTSGTTGLPKGVMISYQNLVSFTAWILSDFHLQEQKRFLCQPPFSFDLSVMDLYPALLTGGTLVALEKGVVADLAWLLKSLPKLALNVWVSTPSLVEICLVDPTFDQEHLPSVTHFLFCGEELPHRVAEKLVTRFPQAFIYNTYGPTEATVAVTSVAITPALLETYERLPLGKVKADTKLMIAPETAAAPGEIVIAGPSVSPGYYGNPEKTAAAFFEKAGQWAYKTGDVGYLKDDLLFYQGRLDFQIKWHGYRIELGDIDHHLLMNEAIRNACVVAKYRDHKVQQLIAYVVLEKPTVDVKACAKMLKE